MANSASSPSGRSFNLRSVPGGALVLELAAGASFDQLRAALRAELGAGGPERFGGATTRLDLGRRDIDLFDLRRLIHLVKDEFGMNVVGLHCVPEALVRLAGRELKVKVYAAAPPAEPEPEPVAAVPEPPPSPPLAGEVEEAPTELVRAADTEEEPETGGGKVLTIDGTVRPGAVVRFGGDIQVFGDVNPGAQVIATGNVLVFGALKGLAHAGARGDDRAIILAFDMRPNQLRIGKVILLPAESGRPSAAPEIAWLSGGSIVIEPYRGRLPSPAHKESP